MKNLIAALICTALLSSPCFAQVSVSDFDGIKLYTITNRQGMTIKVTNYGAIITSIIVPDRDGKLGDVALGYDRVEDYINAVDKPYFGAIVGRYGNRIAKGEFTIEDETYALAVNNGENHLHGGVIGFDKVVWDARLIGTRDWMGLKLSYLAKDMEEGYPGNLDITVTYKLQKNSNELVVEYHATTDKATPVNLTQHTYFNLKGEGEGTILDHELMINAKKYTPVDEGLIPTGETPDVAGTPFDFTSAKPIGRDIGQDHQQLEYGLGYDHNFVLDKGDGGLTLAARVHEPASGRVLEVHTAEPGIQFYCGNFLDGRLKGKSGKSYVHRGGFCLETQHYPDSPNQPDFPSTILTPGEEYRTTTVFKFSAE
jgi:aldose 1-epimerase